jgi:hypothetical protein
VDGIVGSVRSGDQELGIKDARVPFENVVRLHGIHVMHVDSIMNLVAFNTKIATQVSSDDVLTNTLPFSGCVEHLVDVAIESEGRIAYTASKGQVLEPLVEGSDLRQF